MVVGRRDSFRDTAICLNRYGHGGRVPQKGQSLEQERLNRIPYPWQLCHAGAMDVSDGCKIGIGERNEKCIESDRRTANHLRRHLSGNHHRGGRRTERWFHQYPGFDTRVDIPFRLSLFRHVTARTRTANGQGNCGCRTLTIRELSGFRTRHRWGL